MIKILDQLLSENPKGKVRNLGRTGQLALCALVWWTVKEIPEQIKASACKCRHAVTEQTMIDPESGSAFQDWPPVITNHQVIHAREPQ